MKPFYIFLFILTLFIFGIVFYSIQSGNINSQKEALDIINQLSPTPAFFDPANPQGQQQGPPGQQPQGQQQGQLSQEQQLQQTLDRIRQATSITATIRTSKGDIELELYGNDTPITIYNFAAKAQNNFYNNLSFHRVEDWVVQGGDPKGDGTGGGNIPTEFNQRPYVRGSVGVARRNDPQVQNDSQFFITKTDSPHLDGQYTNFGTVTEGMDVVDQIEIGDKILGVTVNIQ